MFSLLLIFFIDTIISVISSPKIACYVTCVQFVQKHIVLKNFAKFKRKHPCRSLFFNKVTGLRSCSFIKKRLNTDVSL